MATLSAPFSLTGSGDMIADRRYDMALQFLERGDMEAAADLMAQARAQAPQWPPAAFRLGEIMAAAGKTTAAGDAFETYLALDPADTMGAIIKLALLGLRPAPKSLPHDYVAGLFDQYAPRFDRHLTQTLGYGVPHLLATMVDDSCPAGLLRILDLGCGTGLAGEALQHRKSWLEGIDLSAGMIAQARAKALYDRLHTGDMVAWMHDCGDSFDLIIAADVLIYAGDLHPVFSAARALMAPGARFAFSLQDGAPAGTYILGADHRYAYSPSYVMDCAASCGLVIDTRKDSVLRQDAGKDVPGLLYLLSAHG